jgi:hypothetical protein
MKEAVQDIVEREREIIEEEYLAGMDTVPKETIH